MSTTLTMTSHAPLFGGGVPAGAGILKSVRRVVAAPPRHWVGDGFPVQGMFGYNDDPAERSPFLLLDYAAPTSFAPNEGVKPRGVATHPHRGFETVTIVYDGEVEHRDSTGAGGVIGPGDVQWMTAGAGILHEEFHSEAYGRTGGPFEMVQLWVNLPARDKMAAPHYQSIRSADIPVVSRANGAIRVRLIAGELDGASGPADTYSPMNVWDVELAGGQTVDLPQPEGWSTLLLVQAGDVRVNGTTVAAGQLVTLDRDGGGLRLVTGEEDVRLLLLAGEPIDEPVVGHGPFVMNTREEIRQAFADYQSGRFGMMPATERELPAAAAGA